MSRKRSRRAITWETNEYLPTSSEDDFASSDEEGSGAGRQPYKTDRRTCPHCQELVSVKTFKTHRRLFYNEVIKHKKVVYCIYQFLYFRVWIVGLRNHLFLNSLLKVVTSLHPALYSTLMATLMTYHLMSASVIIAYLILIKVFHSFLYFVHNSIATECYLKLLLL